VTEAGGHPRTVVLRDGTHVELRDHADEPNVIGVAAWHDGAVVGRMTLTPDATTARLHVTLAPGFEGRRLGTWLVLEAVHMATARGFERVTASPGADARFAEALSRFDFHAGPRAGEVEKRLHRGWPDF
jgi:GNAT superfamily N-acetyltransferase